MRRTERIKHAFVMLALVSSVPSVAIAQSGSWTTKAAMPTPRIAFAGAQVNGVVYAIGGYNTFGGFNLLPSNEAYDPATVGASRPGPRRPGRAAVSGPLPLSGWRSAAC